MSYTRPVWEVGVKPGGHGPVPEGVGRGCTELQLAGVRVALQGREVPRTLRRPMSPIDCSVTSPPGLPRRASLPATLRLSDAGLPSLSLRNAL